MATLKCEVCQATAQVSATSLKVGSYIVIGQEEVGPVEIAIGDGWQTVFSQHGIDLCPIHNNQIQAVTL